MKHAAAWLRRLARSAHSDRLILRGSLLTSQWVPQRTAADIDHVLVPGGSPLEAQAMVDQILALPDLEPLPPATHEVIWADTPWPGLRTKLGDLQIDVGAGDPLAVPPTRVTIHGVSLLAVRPETMFGWKVHGLVELGPGKWKPKDLLDIYWIDRHCELDEAALVASIHLAFTSRSYAFELLDRFLYSGEWGRSRGSRRKWETFAKRWRGPTPIPSFEEVVSHARRRVTPLVEAARSLTR